MSIQVVISGLVGSKSSADFSSHKASMALITPVAGYKQLEASVSLDSTPDQHKVSSRLVTGDKQVTTSTLLLAAPLSLAHVDMDFKAKTPYPGYRSMAMSLSNKLDSGLNTKVSVEYMY